MLRRRCSWRVRQAPVLGSRGSPSEGVALDSLGLILISWGEFGEHRRELPCHLGSTPRPVSMVISDRRRGVPRPARRPAGTSAAPAGQYHVARSRLALSRQRSRRSDRGPPSGDHLAYG